MFLFLIFFKFNILSGKVEISDFGYIKSIEWFKHYDVIAFYVKGYNWYEWRDLLAGKVLRLTRNNISIDAVIANPCQDVKHNQRECYSSLCEDCYLINNSTYKYFVKLEYLYNLF